MSLTTQLSYAEAATILGCHVSNNIPKLIAKGDLTSTGKRGASLDRAEVEALVERRVAERQARATTPARSWATEGDAALTCAAYVRCLG
jgi:hypothetical protein